MASKALSDTQFRNLVSDRGARHVPVARRESGIADIKRPPLPVLTSLRFFAAAAVVVFHVVIGRSGDTIEIDGFPRGLALGGWAAVTFFFVLSGFILTYAHAGRRETDALNITAGSFWRLRIARIAPAYYLGLLLGLPLLIDFIQTSPPTWQNIVAPILVLLYLQAWVPGISEIWNYPAWSLSVEAVFYALFPWLSRVLARLTRNWLFVVAFALVLLSAALRSAAPIAGDGLLQHLPLFHLPSFILGMALGRQFVFGREMSPSTHAAMFLVGVGALIVIFGFDSALPHWSRSDAVLVPAFSLIIFGAARPSGLMILLGLPAFVLLGEASYAIYILHVPARMLWDSLHLALPMWLNLSLYGAVLLSMSILSWRCIETPLRKLIASSPRETSFNQVAHQLPKR